MVDEGQTGCDLIVIDMDSTGGKLYGCAVEASINVQLTWTHLSQSLLMAFVRGGGQTRHAMHTGQLGFGGIVRLAARDVYVYPASGQIQKAGNGPLQRMAKACGH